LQRENQHKSGAPVPRRTFHVKIVVAVDYAELAFADDLPAELSSGDFTPGSRFLVTVRLSNASGTVGSDNAPDLPGRRPENRATRRGRARPADDQLPGLPRP
jgi:hypothetical protein